MFDWMKESNRMLHFKYAIPCGLLSLLFVAGLALGMEFKDQQHGGKFDWLDIAATMLGGCIGQLIMLLLIWIF